MEDFDLDKSLLEIASGTSKSHFTIRSACEGIQIFGGVGSGKSSGSCKRLIMSYLGNFFGGLVLTTKPTDKEEFQEYCRLTNRESDLVIIEPNGKYVFNFLQYESQNAGESITENIVDILKTVLSAGKEKSGGRTDDQFWDTALDMLLFNVVDLCKLAYGKLSIRNLYEIVQSIPKADAEVSTSKGDNKPYHKAFQLARMNVNAKVTQWLATLPTETVDIWKEEENLTHEIENAIPEARLYNFVEQFFNDNYINISEKTRSIIDFTFSGFLFRFLREPIYSLFCRHDSNITPEDCLDGKIILLHLPVKVYNKVGRDCQILFKLLWQRAMEKRLIKNNDRPVFLFADEAQSVIHELDTMFQATARSSRIATLYATQNLSNYNSCMGGDKAKDRVNSFLGTLGTKIFHANADIETNKYASELIGDAYFIDETSNVTMGEGFTHGKGKSLKLDRVVRPEEFNRLKTGGPKNNYAVEGYMHRQGDSLFHGKNHQKMSFNQNYIP